jgi:hypothetical protein
MKKFLYLLILSFCIPVQNFAINGDGSFGSPFNGSLSSDMTWSGTVYVNGDVVNNAYALTISAGSTIIFLTIDADLIISGTGTLTAAGTTNSRIVFTKGTGNTDWGHISFTGTGICTLTYCTIEYGKKTGADFEGYGGGLFLDNTNVTLSYCNIQHNFAKFGGGIFVGASKNPSIKRCAFFSNVAEEAGGGLYMWNYSSCVVENCIFDSNHASGTTYSVYTGGGLTAQSNGSVKILNCTFVNNSSGRVYGQNLQFYGSVNSIAYNCIFWGPGEHISQTGTNSFVNCAFQTYIPFNSTNCLVLNSVNTATNGPNFVTTDGSNWSLKYISPCRDNGTTTTPALTTDYLGNARVGTYDIGAYEVQYSRWKTDAATTDWNTTSNWDGLATNSAQVIYIPSGATGYPTDSPGPDFTINSGNELILAPGAKATLGTLTNNGTLKLSASSTGLASLILNTYTKGGGATEEIQLYLTGGGSAFLEDYKWHYISSPVTSLSTNTFTGATLDLAQFVESRPALSLLQGWVAYDGYVYSTGLSNGPTFSSLTPGKGYNFWDNANNTFTFGGLFNTSNTAMSLSYSGVPSRHGFNLLGNPFSSGLNWDDIANSVYFPYPANTSKGIYFTHNNIQYTYINGLGTPGTVTGIIPPMQAFFTKTYSTLNTITIPAAARTHNSIPSTYKGSSVIPHVRLELKRDSISDEAVVRFDDLAKSDLDNDFDAVKMFISTTNTQIYSSLGGTDYAINGQPFPETFVEIPIVINVTKDTIHTITATQLQGLDFYTVTLKDNVTGFVADLKTTPELTFSVSAGTVTDRFILKVSNGTTGTEYPAASKNYFNIYPSNRLINIQTLADDWDGKSGTVKVLDLTGKTISDLHDVEFTKNSVIQVTGSGAKGMYVVEIRSGAKRYVGKVVIK